MASLTMILLAALLCNYGRGFCLIDVGTEGSVELEAIKQALNLEKTIEGADLVINRFKLQVI